MLKLAHISDLHYTEASRKRVADLFEVVRRSGVNHLIVTGDLTADAKKEHLAQVRELLYSHGFSSTDALTVIPGNHDIFGFIYQTFSAPNKVVGRIRSTRDMLAVVKTLWHFRRRLMAYNDSAYDRSLCDFRSYFQEAYEDCLPVPGGRCGFPFIKLLPDNVALIGVDTNRLVPRSYNILKILTNAHTVARNWNLGLVGENLSGSTGYVDMKTMRGALEMPVLVGRRKIVVMHHYLYPLAHVQDMASGVFAREMQLRNRDETSDLLISHGVDLVLHGHWHIVDSYPLDGALGPKALNAGGSLWSGFNRIEASPSGLRYFVGARN